MKRYFGIAMLVGCLAAMQSGDVHGAPPFSGTIFIDPDIITPADPTTFQGSVYTGQALRQMFDRRTSRFSNVNAYEQTMNSFPPTPGIIRCVRISQKVFFRI